LKWKIEGIDAMMSAYRRHVVAAASGWLICRMARNTAKVQDGDAAALPENGT
jgi:hypothetical protein